MGLPLKRRVSWADSDLITPVGIRIEVKASAYWQSWKLVNEDGTRKPIPPQIDPNRVSVRFGGLQARTAVSPAPEDDPPRFKSDLYVFCLHCQTDAAAWDAWQLSHWEFYTLTREELSKSGVGKSISLATLRKIRPAMNAREFQSYMQCLLHQKLV